jgi:FMN phosphatase YigB (HAD superfamily)
MIRYGLIDLVHLTDGARLVERDTPYFQRVCQHCALEPTQCLLIEPNTRIRQSAERIGIHTAPDLTALQSFASA